MSGPIQSFRLFINRYKKPAAIVSGAYAASTLAAGLLAGKDGAQDKAWTALFFVLAAAVLFLLTKGVFALSDRLKGLSGGRMGDVLQIFFIALSLSQLVYLGLEFFRSYHLLYVPLFAALEGVFVGCLYRKYP
ncbi:MAG: hypothetical protein AB9835_08930 [Eubacteriales bacterium]